MVSFSSLFLNVVLVIAVLWISIVMKGYWLPLMCCFIGAILSKVCWTKSSNESYDIFLTVLKQVQALSEFSIIKTFIVTICNYQHDLWLYEAYFKKTAILWKTDRPVSIVLAFKNLSCLLVSIRSMHQGFLGFL